MKRLLAIGTVCLLAAPATIQPLQAQALNQDFGATLEMFYRAITGRSQNQQPASGQTAPRPTNSGAGRSARGEAPVEGLNSSLRMANEGNRLPTEAAQHRALQEDEPQQDMPRRATEAPAPDPAGVNPGPGSETQNSSSRGAEAPLHSAAARIYLGDGRLISGRISFRTPERFVLRHIADGVAYERPVSLAELRTVEVKRWRGRPGRELRDGQVYRFEPDRTLYILADGSRLLVEGPILPFLSDFPLANQHGAVRFFTFWMDLLKADGSWYTGISGPTSGERTMCHPDVIKRIVFEHEFDG
ncbi:MAG: hypothetical protein K1X75_02475 [Leptospirales bacterium]|nr:hypothetical protein [Leptospirales bacterium]